MQTNIPTEEEVLGYFKSLANWGRWAMTISWVLPT